MFRKKLTIIYIFLGLFFYTCGSNNQEKQTSPDNAPISGNANVDDNLDEVLAELHMQIKNLKAELDYHHEDLTKVKAQTKIFTNPIAV